MVVSGCIFLYILNCTCCTTKRLLQETANVSDPLKQVTLYLTADQIDALLGVITPNIRDHARAITECTVPEPARDALYHHTLRSLFLLEAALLKNQAFTS